MLRARKHKIGKRERVRLENELKEVKQKIETLLTKDSDGFKSFYDDVENSKKLVERQFLLEEWLQRGSYHIVKEFND